MAKQGLEFSEFLNRLGALRPLSESEGLLGSATNNELTLFDGPEIIIGPSVYDLAIEEGFIGTKAEFLETLKGVSAYDVAVEEGFVGTRPSWLNTLRGLSAYQLAVNAGFVGSVSEYLESLQGKSVYDLAVESGFSGTFEQFVDSLKVKGDIGDQGPRGYTMGVPLTYSIAITNSDPGSGKYKFNSTVYAEITAITISHVNADGDNIVDWINSIGNVPNFASRGVLRFQNIDAMGGFSEFIVTGERTITATHTRIPVIPLSGTLPAPDAKMAVTFAPVGVYAIPYEGIYGHHINTGDAASIREALDIDSRSEANTTITQTATEVAETVGAEAAVEATNQVLSSYSTTSQTTTYVEEVLEDYVTDTVFDQTTATLRYELPRQNLNRKDPGIIVPFYIYPNNPYSDAVCLRLFEAIRTYSTVPVILVVNPSNGPGTVVDGNYTAFIKLAKATGAKVIGYVSTDFAASAESTVKSAIDTWIELYPEIDGIFLDEQPYDVGPGNTGDDYVQLYKRYTDYAHSLSLFPVVSNPGSAPQAVWFDTHTSDIAIVHENTTWPSLESNWIGGNVDYDTARRAAIVYNQATLDSTAVRDLTRYVNWVYVTDDNMTGEVLNPWDSLPTYLEGLFEVIDKSTLSITNALDTRLDAVETATTTLDTTLNSRIDKSRWLHSGRNFVDGTLINTGISEVGDSVPFLVEIKGNSYDKQYGLTTLIQGYIYNSTIINTSVVNMGGAAITGLRVFILNGTLHIWFPSQGYWHGYAVFSQITFANFLENLTVSIANAVMPSSGVTREVVPTTRNAVFSITNSGLLLWTGSQAQYDAIGTKDPNTLYFIT